MKKSFLLLLIIVLSSITAVKSQTYNYYYGNIHSQTSYSDGNQDSATSLITKPIQAFNYARNSQHIDFYGISDHNHASAGFSNLANYHKGIADALTATTGSFVAMYGFEWGIISGGGHVIVYGCDSLMGWDTGLNDIYVAQNDYTNLWKKVIARPNSFAYLCHPTTTDYGNILTTAVNINADSAIIGMAGRSGPAFSTNTTYSNPSSSNYISQYNDALKFGYHVGIGLDHDTHNSVFGRQTAGRLVVLAPSLTKANIYNAFKKMRFYCSDDWNTKVNFQILNQPMGSIITHSGTPTLSVTITDPDVAESVSSIVVYYGVPGSGTTCTALTTVTNTTNLTYTHSAATNLSKHYYYLEITQADGDKIYTSPIWYNRNDAVVALTPVASCSTPTSTICSGQSATFTDASSNAPTSWTWHAIGASPSTSSLQNPTFTYTTSGTYSVTLISSNSSGSSAMITKTLTVLGIPIIAASNATVCSGTSANLTASGATTYSWNTGATTSSVSVTPATSTNYTVTGYNAGCANNKVVTVTVNSTPTVTANSATICPGSSANLTASGGTSYLWSTGATTSSISVTPTSNTNYSVTGTSNGCPTTKLVSVTVNTNPTVTATGVTICSGSSANLTATGATAYSWNTGATTSSISVSPSATTNYTVTGSNFGCTNTKTLSVIVNPTPTVIANGSTICSGSSINLSASGATSYIWNTGATTSSITVAPASTTNYTVTGTTGSCLNAKSVTVTVNNLPNVSVSSTTICAGSTGTLAASGASTYTWNSGATGANLAVSPTINTTYTVTGASTVGCIKTSTASVTVGSAPSIAVNSTSICSGSNATLTASGVSSYTWNTGANSSSIYVNPTASIIYTVTGNLLGCNVAATNTVGVLVVSIPTVSAANASICAGSFAILNANGASLYAWNTGATSASISVTPTVSTNYTVTGTTSGCSKTTTTSVIVHPNPTAPIITSIGNTLTSNVSTGNQWYLNGILISGAINQTYISTQNGNYTDIVTNTFGCNSIPSNSIAIVTTGIETLANLNDFSIYPNPTSGLISISFNSINSNTTIEIINELGQTLYSVLIRDCKELCTINYDFKSFSNGIYFVKVISNNNIECRKIIVQK
jgi:PKD repeat protein